MPKLTKSKERIKKLGEVFTPEWVVKDMCDMVADNADCDPFDLKHTFIEPSFGNGQFVVEILARKMAKCKCESDYIQAIKTIYGIEFMQDNVDECIERCLKLLDGKAGPKAERLLRLQLQQGDTLKGIQADGRDIVFMDWAKGEPFVFKRIGEENKKGQLNLL